MRAASSCRSTRIRCATAARTSGRMAAIRLRAGTSATPLCISSYAIRQLAWIHAACRSAKRAARAASMRSLTTSRMLGSIRYLSASTESRLPSTRAAMLSIDPTPPSPTISMASSPKGDSKIVRSSTRSREGASSSPRLQSSVASSVRWRAGRSRGPCGNGRCSARRCSRSAGDRARLAAAASSIARGSPSRRSAIARTGPPSRSKRATCTLPEEVDSRVHIERFEVDDVLRRDPQRRPGCRKHVHARYPSKEVDDRSSRSVDLLEVVKDEEGRPIAESRCEGGQRCTLGGTTGHPGRLCRR